jgi:hypothetical protein
MPGDDCIVRREHGKVASSRCTAHRAYPRITPATSGTTWTTALIKPEMVPRSYVHEDLRV